MVSSDNRDAIVLKCKNLTRKTDDIFQNFVNFVNRCGGISVTALNSFENCLSNNTKHSATTAVSSDLCLRKVGRPYAVETCSCKAYEVLNLQYNSLALHILAH